jgi:hypothetical protein
LASIFILNGDNSNKEYIMLNYTGDGAKPYPVFVFYLQGHKGKVMEEFFITKFEINEKQFETIRKAAEESEDLFSGTTLESPYQFTFMYNEDTTIFLTSFLNRIEKVFQTVLEQFNYDSEKQTLLRKRFDSFLHRLKYENQLKWQ